VHSTAIGSDGAASLPESVRALHDSIPVTDLLVGSAIMRPEFLPRRNYGHVDLPRAVDGGLDLLGLSIATRLPNLIGTYSTPFFWSQGLSLAQLRTPFTTALALLDRIDGWVQESAGRLRLIQSSADLDGVGTSDILGAFVGIQGGHVLDGDLRNLERLVARGVRMLAPAHVMDNDLVGSGTGKRRGGLTAFGREVIEECQRQRVVVDLAHMSDSGVHDALPLLQPPFVLSHGGFRELSGKSSWWRNYSPATRNISVELARDVAQAGGVVGLTISTLLLGGESLDAFGRAIELGLESCGVDSIAIGSDMDGALKMLVDAAGLPLLTAELVRRGLPDDTIAGVMGRNALRVLREVLAA
jgi:microsomal dipeptidase-like Zn-dependent dipeptidase